MALSGGIVLEEAVDLSSDRLLMMIIVTGEKRGWTRKENATKHHEYLHRYREGNRVTLKININRLSLN
jgi:hypothetical protein